MEEKKDKPVECAIEDKKLLSSIAHGLSNLVRTKNVIAPKEYLEEDLHKIISL